MVEAYRWFTLFVAVLGLIESLFNVGDSFISVREFRHGELASSAREQFVTEIVLFWFHFAIVLFGVLSVMHLTWVIVARTVFLLSSIFATVRSLNARRVRRQWRKQWSAQYDRSERRSDQPT